MFDGYLPSPIFIRPVIVCCSVSSLWSVFFYLHYVFSCCNFSQSLPLSSFPFLVFYFFINFLLYCLWSHSCSTSLRLSLLLSLCLLPVHLSYCSFFLSFSLCFTSPSLSSSCLLFRFTLFYLFPFPSSSPLLYFNLFFFLLFICRFLPDIFPSIFFLLFFIVWFSYFISSVFSFNLFASLVFYCYFSFFRFSSLFLPYSLYR